MTPDDGTRVALFVSGLIVGLLVTWAWLRIRE